MLNFHPGDTFTLSLPDGTQGHVKVVGITDRVARLAFSIPDELRVTRDTPAAHKVFKND